MSELVAIVGESGTGKSTALGGIPELGIKGLNPAETIIINTMGKPLPFPKWKNQYKSGIKEGGNYIATTNTVTITKILDYIDKNRPEIKNIIIDDFQYILADKFMSDVFKKGFDKFNELGKQTYDVLNISRSLRDDIKVFILTHSEQNEYGLKIKTIGSLLDSKVTLEGLFTIVLYTKVTRDSTSNKAIYEFVTNHDGEYPAKSPVGMFESLYIPNDLNVVITKIDNYNN